MKQLFVLFIFIGLFLTLNSCDTKDTANDQKYGLSKEEAKAKLKELSVNLATNREWLSIAVSENIEKGNIPLSKVTNSLPSQLVIGGVVYDVKVSLFNYGETRLSLLSKISDESPYGVMIDADRFYSGETLVPIDYWNGSSLESREVSLLWFIDDDEFITEEEELARERAIDSVRASIGYPLFSLDVEQSYDDPEIENEFRSLINERLSEFNKTTVNPQPYLVIKQLNLHDKKDHYSNDEYEMYIGESVNNAARIFSTTIHRFNGKTRNDAAQRPVYYRDVNGDQGWEIMPNDIAVFLLKWIDPNAWMRTLPIEDDDDAGKHDYEDGPTIRQAWVKYYEVFSNTIKTNFWDLQVASPSSFWGDNDDLYRQAGIDQINKNSVQARLGSNYLNEYIKLENRILNDVDYWFGVREY